MPWKIAIVLSKFGSVSNILFFILSILWNISKISFNVSFGWHHFLLDIFILSITTTFFICVKKKKVILTKFSGCPPRAMNGSYFFYNSTYIQFRFHIHIYHFVSILLFYLFGQFSTSIIHFCKISYEFITLRLTGNTTTHFSVCAWTNSSGLTNHHQIFKEVMGLITDHDDHLLCSDLWIEGLAAMCFI